MEKRGIDGLLVVDKPEGITSLDMVRRIKHRYGLKKAGHIGTLDPFATGVLPIVLNEGTKLVPFLVEGPKEYEVTLKLGEETTTDDCTGQVVSRRDWTDIQPEAVESLLRTFLGKIDQIPPMFSAVKMQGMPLYRLARKGIEEPNLLPSFSVHRDGAAGWSGKVQRPIHHQGGSFQGLDSRVRTSVDGIGPSSLELAHICAVDLLEP